MAEKKSEQSRGGGTGSGGGQSPMVQVLVECRVPAGSDASASMAAAGRAVVSGFQMDSGYEPVPIEPSEEQSDLAASLSESREALCLVRGQIPEDQIEELRKQPGIEGVYIDTQIEPFERESIAAEDSDFVGMVDNAAFGNCPIPQCDCKSDVPKGTLADVARYIKADEVWASGNEGQNIVVAVVDGGTSAVGRVPGGRIRNVIGGWPTNDWGTRADWGQHGNMSATDVLGIAPKARLYDIRISAGGIQATISAAIAGYNWAINQHKANGTPHVMTNSWGIYQKAWDEIYATKANHPFTRKVVEAINEGILVLFAAGNCGEACPSGRCGSDTGPGKSIWGANGHPRVMTVGAANTRGELVGYSSQGPSSLDQNKPDFCGISHFRGYFNSDNGTSAACPVAAGAVALMKQARPNLSQADAKQRLRQTARNLGPAGWDQHSGTGIIDVKAAIGLGPTPVDRCQRFRELAARALAAYRRSRNRRYLCLYYRYLAQCHACWYRSRRNRRYLCQYYRYIALYYRCIYRQSRNRRHLCLYYRYYAAYFRCLYAVTRNRAYLCRHYYYQAFFYRCQYAVTGQKKYLALYRRYYAAYRRCRGS